MESPLELMKSYLDLILPAGTVYADDGHANLKATLPKVDNMADSKTVTLVFDESVIREIATSSETGDRGATERVGNYLCDKLGGKFAEWETNNVHLKWHVGSEALDER